MSKADFSDEELTAYLDDEASPELRQRIDAARIRHPHVAARIAELEAPLAQLNVELDALSTGDRAALASSPEQNSPIAAPHRGWSVFGATLAASLAAGLLLGGALGQLVSRGAPSDWRYAVADYQRLYVPETLADVAQSRASTSRVLSAFEEALGIALGDVTAVAGATFKRAQLLGFEGAPLLQIAFIADDGAPIALCVTPVAGSDSGPQLSEYDGLLGVDWIEDGNGFLLIGDVPEALLRRLAAEIRTL